MSRSIVFVCLLIFCGGREHFPLHLHQDEQGDEQRNERDNFRTADNILACADRRKASEALEILGGTFRIMQDKYEESEQRADRKEGRVKSIEEMLGR